MRIGVNWGSLDQELLAPLMDDNAAPRRSRWDAKQVMYQALVQSALQSAEVARELGLNPDNIIISCKVSGVQDLIAVYRALARALRLRAAPGPDRGRHGHQGHGRLGARRWRCCCRKASATPSASA